MSRRVDLSLQVNAMTALDASSVAALLREFGQRSTLRGGNPFRAKAYARAADNLLALSIPLETVIAHDRLQAIPGIGDAIADIIKKLHATCTHPALEKMRKEIPAGVVDMLTIPGLRTEKVVKIYNELGITSLDELEKAAREGQLQKVKGLGAALETKILRGLEMRRESPGKRHMHRAAELLRSAEVSLQEVTPDAFRITPAGDFRRGCELVGDLTLVAEVPKLRMSINPDAHSTREIDLTHWGVEMARKGGVPKERVLNCLSKDDFATYLEKRRVRRLGKVAASRRRVIHPCPRPAHPKRTASRSSRKAAIR